MKRYHEEFVNNQSVDLKNAVLKDLNFEERFWLLACKCNEYYQAKDKYLAVLCMTRIKELTFLWACANRVNKCGFLDEKYKQYAVDFEFAPSNDKLINIDKDLNGTNKRKLRYELISYFFMLICIAVMVTLYSVFDVNIILSIGIASILSVFFNSVVVPFIARHLKNKNKEEIAAKEVPNELKDIIAYDERLNDIIKEKDYQPLLAAKNEKELNEAIKNYPKK